jgi:hypothetical protein
VGQVNNINNLSMCFDDDHNVLNKPIYNLGLQFRLPTVQGTKDQFVNWRLFVFLCLQYKIMNGNPVWLFNFIFSKLKKLIYFKHTHLWWFERRSIGKPQFQKHVLENWFLIHPVSNPSFSNSGWIFKPSVFYKVFKKKTTTF